MTFLIRTIDFTASGREIVRDREVEQSSLTIGRASESDIHLPDLAVEQQHATLTSNDDGTILAEAVGTLGFTHDGKTTTSTSFDPAKGAELGFGGYRLAFSRDPDAPASITISKTAEHGEDVDDVKGFALGSALPSKRVMAWIGLGVILFAFLIVPIYTHLNRDPAEPDYDRTGHTMMDASWSTGALSLAHHGLEDNCEACHVKPFESVRDETCLTCHEAIGDHAEIDRQLTGRGPMSAGDEFQWKVAGMFGKEGPGSCTTCHTEHEGAGRMEPTAQQFCSECHDGMDERLTDTKLENAADFGDAHPQFKAIYHPQLGSEETARISLADKPQEQHGLKFPHDMHMDKSGGVARMARNIGAKQGYGNSLVCADCHTPTSDKEGFLPVNMEEDCESCHSLVYDRVGTTFRSLRHGDVDQMRADLRAMDRAPRRSAAPVGRKRPGEYARGGLYYQNFGRPARSYIAINRALASDGVCGECHIPTTNNGKADVVPVHLRDNYLLNGWFDHKEHEQEKCSTCHKAETSKTSEDLLLPGIAICRDCHLGQDAKEAEVPSSCAMCHSYHPKGATLPGEEKSPTKDTVALMSRKPE
ncbi:cytochrome c3 family protein [Pontixanthobacter sp. CEM42]|uniref:cytochrome c3 family protein n=1 Tax=Pontixanthobacter sp. CEM42 TaxID=2792077 RepID=UPI001AE05BD6|nr:cytochrome c3 family protein [Pontixanthobacter sp. CEM42]